MLTFNEDLHEYRQDGFVIPSVTAILADYMKVNIGGYDYHVNRHTGQAIPSSVMEEAAAKGTDIHKCCQFINQGGLDWDALDPLYQKPAKEYERWLSLYSPKIIGCEVMVYSVRYGFAGTIDIVAEFQGLRWIIDIKTGASCSVGAQTAAYLQAYCEQEKYHGLTARGVLWLPKDGKPHKFERLTDKGDFDYFKACLAVHQYHRR